MRTEEYIILTCSINTYNNDNIMYTINIVYFQDKKKKQIYIMIYIGLKDSSSI